MIDFLLLLLISVLISVLIGWLWKSKLPIFACHESVHSGNEAKYNPAAKAPIDDNPLYGMTIAFLGSSVTLGSEASNTSFVDYLKTRNGFTAIKESVSGTTLVDEGAESYIKRLEGMDVKLKLDLLVCQLSTNDASQEKSQGVISNSMDSKDFDKKTITGAVEYIIAYTRDTWKCPVLFFTNARYESDRYAEMVDMLLKVQVKWKIGLIDLWNPIDFNQLSDSQRNLYMVDAVHPTKAGYRDWWTPEMEHQLYDYVMKSRNGLI